MTLLVLGIVIFFAVHLVPSTSLKTALVDRLGRNGYRIVFSLVAAVGLLLIIWGKAHAPFVHVWSALPDLRHLTFLMVWFAFVLLPAAHMPSNVKRITRNPMLWGIILWGSGHLLVNGDLASMLLFGSFVLYSVIAIVLNRSESAKSLPDSVPFVKDIAVLGAGSLVYLVVFFSHRFLFGYPLI